MSGDAMACKMVNLKLKDEREKQQKLQKWLKEKYNL